MSATASTPKPARRRRTADRGRDLPLLPLDDVVVFPDSMTPLIIANPRSVRLLEHAAQEDERVVLVTRRPGTEHDDTDPPTRADLYDVGTLAEVQRLIRVPDGSVRALVQGEQRVRIERLVSRRPFTVGRVRPLPDRGRTDTTEVEAVTRQLQHVYGEIVEHAEYLPEEVRIVAANVDSPSELAHLIASTLRIETHDKQRVLETTDIAARLRLLLQLASHELEVAELGSRIQSEVHVELTRTQRDFVLRQQLKAIQEELGDEDDDVAELRARLAALPLPERARTQVDRELGRLARTPEQSGEHGVIRSYLEWIVSLPWGTTSQDDLDLAHAASVLDEDHFGLERVKDRILDHLAVSRLRGDVAGQVLCLGGPPGVGTTSLGRSIARALGRSFARVSLGGVRDEAEIRGHRRTYVGAMPGSVIRSLRDAGTSNPVFMVDEIDKLGSDWRGDPSSAMLEVLDPEQNGTFRDHYLDVPFDLSRVLFVCTANRLDTIPPALRDRMEIIRMSGYTEDEKVAIARGYLLPKQRREHGLKVRQIGVGTPTLRRVVREWTHEAGVRELDRQIATLCRKAARHIADGRGARLEVAPEDLEGLLGPRSHAPDRLRTTASVGVATGLAVTGAGGDVLFVEAAAMPGTGRLTITGQIGQVMEESARAAHSWVRSQAEVDGEPDVTRFFETHDIHVHVPAGAIPKDGPSAGVAMATAIASLARDLPVRIDLAMTGEITLTGDVLPVGGVRDKVLAAQRAGIRNVLVPEANEEDLDEIPPHLAGQLTFHLVDHVDQVLALAFDLGAVPAGQ